MRRERTVGRVHVVLWRCSLRRLDDGTWPSVPTMLHHSRTDEGAYLGLTWRGIQRLVIVDWRKERTSA